MPVLPESEYRRLKAIVYNGLVNDELLTPFQRTFLADYMQRFEQYERQTYVSDAQEATFDKIEQTLRDELSGAYVENPR